MKSEGCVTEIGACVTGEQLCSLMCHCVKYYQIVYIDVPIIKLLAKTNIETKTKSLTINNLHKINKNIVWQ